MIRPAERDTEELVAEFEQLAQELTRLMKKSAEPLKADFPRGYIRPLWQLKSRWPYLPDDKARTAACTIQLCDVNRWNLNMWTIQWTAGDLCEWQASVPLIALVEMIMVEYAVAVGWTDKPPRTFSDAISYLFW